MSKAKHITDEMFMGSAHTLASLTTESDLAQGSLYPSLSRVREVSAHIAAGFAKTAHRRGIATAQGGTWYPATVKRAVERLEALEGAAAA